MQQMQPQRTARINRTEISYSVALQTGLTCNTIDKEAIPIEYGDVSSVKAPAIGENPLLLVSKGVFCIMEGFGSDFGAETGFSTCFTGITN